MLYVIHSVMFYNHIRITLRYKTKNCHIRVNGWKITALICNFSVNSIMFMCMGLPSAILYQIIIDYLED